MGALEGKVALITGGTTGIGLGMAERFLGEGARVAITGRDRELGARAEQALRERGDAVFIVADAADEAAVNRSVAETVDRFGGLDILVNNAGVGVEATLLDTPVADFDRIMAINLRGPFLYARAAYPHLAERRGSMIHISSDAGITGERPIAAYSVSKAALIMLSKMLALDGAKDGVRSNCICPGGTEPGMRHMGPPGDPDREERAESWERPPLGRLGVAADIAAAAVFFASDEAAFYTGAVLLADGGMQAGRLG
ncbi:MAG TPA: glucose 1-dehydrogenase [Chloroflexota bacterium]|nr:glucose 1-dehydrogenase [Chloroflexota bacterium]